MKSYSIPKYEIYREWMKTARNKEYDWDQIELGMTASEQELEEFLENQKKTNWWDITSTEWKDLVKLEKEAEEETQELHYKSSASLIANNVIINKVTIPTNKRSSWQLYKKVLNQKGINKNNVEEIENSTENMLQKLSNDTQDSQPIKGLVIGNVQSGKTANMGALMAMAADWYWNLFIILSGTIDSLREQTEHRLFTDLNQAGSLTWHNIKHPSPQSPVGTRLQDLDLNESSKQRYLTVCLKNATRLRQLLNWINSDVNKKRQLKIILIDDEADQAGVNTGNIFLNERKTINKLITNLVNNGYKKSKQSKLSKFKAINYIGYTATPYANVLNDSSLESLYPKDFIAALAVSENYFSPQLIFGIENSKVDKLDIVREIDGDNLNHIKKIHNGLSKNIPNSLQKAICWFLCGVSCMRLWGYKKPISMLVHTSQRTNHHQYIADSIRLWIQAPKSNNILGKCYGVWEYETRRFSLERFKEQFPNYDYKNNTITDYPSFEDIEKEIEILLQQITNIQLDDDQTLSYHSNIHLCIDNCKNSGITNDNTVVRLVYPQPHNLPSPAPAFIVVGGTTLSRGLTLEGLISTYFLRSVGQADTLMQMGRWFGYRVKYELIPRIWLTRKTISQFEFLSDLDLSLRNEISQMESRGQLPNQYGPKIKNTPMYNFIRITSKKKMQSAIAAEYDFRGAFMQTTLFDNDLNTLNDNLNLTENFINNLGSPTDNKNNIFAQNSLIWKNIPFNTVEKMLMNFKFHKRQRSFTNMNALLEWIRLITKQNKLDNWNIIVSGKKVPNKTPDPFWILKYGKVNKVSRSRKIDFDNDNLINIGVLTDPNDIIADIDYRISDEIKFKQRQSLGTSDFKKLRNDRGLEKTPQLIIYIIDKHSKAAKNATSRVDLRAKADIVGFCINIPGGKKGTNYATELTVKLDETNIFYEGDLENTNEN